MLSPIAGFVTAFLVSYSFLPFIIRFSKKQKLGAKPGRRRIHKRITPSLGGVAIFMGFTVASLIWNVRIDEPLVVLALPVLIIPFIIGLLDDLIHLKPAAKLIAQFTTSSLLFLLLDVRIDSFYSLYAGTQFPVMISYLVTIATVTIITNSLNLIDGIDGLAATFSLVACLFFGCWFLFSGSHGLALICFSLAGGVLAFLFQNWEPSNIFMGDTGSLVIGTLLSIIMIRFVDANHSLQETHPMKFNGSVATALCAMIIPLVDTTRIIIVRLSKGISPLTADKRHIHHGLVRLGFTHQKAVYILTLVHVAMIGLAVLLRNESEWLLLALVVAISIALCLWLDSALFKTVRDGADTEGSSTPG